MGKTSRPEPVKLVVGLLAASTELLGEAAHRLGAIFGPIDEQSPPVPFAYTSYYAEELGQAPWRQWLSFARLIDPGELAGIKIQTNALEAEWTVEGRRPVNLDPGYISLTGLTLATTKGFWHRIYIGQGIYAEVTLPFHRGAFRPQEWTYPDYRAPEHIEFFTQLRRGYREQLRSMGTAST